jgi:aspartyl-tRNA(Asn)/glutamyl-tRNA(Gln) amidotransferase subunit C
MKIDRELVLHVAKLAHVELSEQETVLFAEQLQKILDYIEKLNEVKQSAEPFSFASAFPSSVRSDAVLPSLPVEDALKNAPDRVKRFFRVPRILP